MVTFFPMGRYLLLFITHLSKFTKKFKIILDYCKTMMIKFRTHPE